MNRIFSFDQAVKWSVIMFSLILLFHFVVILGIALFDFVPVDYLWGGRMETKEELLNFELVSLVVMLLCLSVVLIRSGKINSLVLIKASRIILWILTALFFLNTIGNLLATSLFEKFFSLITIILALLCLRMALEPVKASNKTS